MMLAAVQHTGPRLVEDGIVVVPWALGTQPVLIHAYARDRGPNGCAGGVVLDLIVGGGEGGLLVLGL